MRFFLVLICLLCPAIAQGYDAASFDPRPVVVTPKGSGSVPVGTIVAWPSYANPSDASKWLECNGQAYSSTLYPDLYAILKNIYGSNTPNYTGMFLRGYGGQAHIQNNGSTVGNTSTWHESSGLGVTQGDAIRNISGYLGTFDDNMGPMSGAFYIESNRGWDWVSSETDKGSFDGRLDASRVVPTASEIRPVNKSVRYFIRALP